MSIQYPKALLVWVAASLLAFSFVGFTESRSTQDHQIEQQDKLLIVVIDGWVEYLLDKHYLRIRHFSSFVLNKTPILICRLRWDHLDVFTRRTGRIFPGFKNFQDGGVKTEYLKSVFPSESFPSWQSISTGKRLTQDRLDSNYSMVGI